MDVDEKYYGIELFVKELKKLNPKGNFHVERQLIVGSMPENKLSLPVGFYYSEKNGLTNKNATRSGLYECFTYRYKPQSWWARILKRI